MGIHRLWLGFMIIVAAWGVLPKPARADESLERWIATEKARAEAYLMRNVSPPGALPGAIVASPSRVNPDYDYHWVRDSGIAVKAVLGLYGDARDPAERARYFTQLMAFVDFSRRIQKTAAAGPHGLGEARFTVTGGLVPGPWGNPQDDGPAIRAIELTHLAFDLLDEGREPLVRAKLYDGKLPSDSVIKADLEYIAAHWRQTCFDPWEETRGHHFYTRLLERKALVEGAYLAVRLGDLGAARWYLAQANDLGLALPRHWDPARGYLRETLDRDGGVDYKASDLDAAVIVATLGGYSVRDLHEEDLYPVAHEQVMATAVALEDAFARIYAINAATRGIPGIAIGRYSEDRYDGYRTDSRGNPWPSLTIAFAMYYYKLASHYRETGVIPVTETNRAFFAKLPLRSPIAFVAGALVGDDDPRFAAILQALRDKGDAFLARVRYHANPDGTLSEQMNRETGYQQGAPNLSMNYAGFLLATSLRAQVMAP